MTLYEKSEKFVIDTFTNAGKTQGIKHFLRTVYWLKQLKPDADEAMCVAAVGHDIERASRQKDEEKTNTTEGYQNDFYLKYHPEKGAEIMAEFLKKEGANDRFIERVKYLISKHEVGGDDDQNLLKDADSISFMENQTDHFIEKSSELGSDVVKNKFDRMFDRISSDNAKDICRVWYDKAFKKLYEK